MKTKSSKISINISVLLFLALALSLAMPTQSARAIAVNINTFTFPGGNLTTTNTNSWGGYNSQNYGVHFNIDAGPLTVEYLGVNAYPINYTGDFGWPPDPTDTGASAIVGLGDGTNIAQYSFKSNMSGSGPRGTTPETYGKGSWDHQGIGHWNDDGYRSYLFQGQYTGNWVATVGNSQYNAEKHGGPTGTNPDYDTFDIKIYIEKVAPNTYKVTGWHNLWKSSAIDEGCGWDWNYAKNAHDPAKRGYLKMFEGTWTANGGLDLSNVQVFLAIQNWQGTQPGLHTFDWDSVVVTGTVVPPSEVWVDGAWSTNNPGDVVSGHTFGYNAFATIQAAVTAVASGGTVNVAAGTYTENVNLNKRLTLNGAGSDSDPVSNTVITSNVANTPVVKIQASGNSDSERLTLSNIRVSGSGTASHGIEIVSGGSYTTFSNVASVGNQGSGVYTNLSGLLQDVKILNCTFSNNVRLGFRTGSNTSIDGLTITDTHADNNMAGLYFNGPLTGLTLTGGTFNDNHNDPAIDPSMTSGLGIYAVRFDLFAVQRPMVLSGFTANNNVRGLIINKFYGPFSVSDAFVSNNSEEGIAIAPGANVTDPITFHNVTANNNAFWNLWVISYLNFTVSNMTIDACTFNGSTGTGNGYGLYLYAASGSALSNVAVTGSTLTGNNTGVYLRAGNATTSTLTGVSFANTSIGSNGTGILITDNAAAGNSAHFNNFVGNTVIGIQNNDPNDIFDATKNWWGAVYGPEIVGPGTINPVSTSVDFTPWCGNAACSVFYPPFPVAHDQSVSTDEDTAKAITLTADGNTLTYSVVAAPSHGVLTGSAPALTYTPAANYNGPDSFTFKVNDGTVDSGPATVSITVTAVNNAPVANAQSVTTAEDTAKAITLTGTDADGDTLTYSVVADPSHGTLSGSAPALTYTPAANYNGADSFTFKVNDGTVDSVPATVSITVTPVNNAPTNIALSKSNVDENRPSGTLVGTLSSTDPDPGDTFTYSLSSAAGCSGVNNASFQISGSSLKTKAVFNYESKPSYTICIQTNDGQGGTFKKQFTISVNDLPETFTSTGSQDGWVLESTETSGVGGTLNATATTFNLGDDASNRQYRAILSFNTASLPNNAVITKVTLKIKYQGLVGTNPFTTHGNILVDIKKGYFSTSNSLQTGDFQATASRTAAGTITNTPASGWYSVSFGSSTFTTINKTGLTQFRLRFQLDDNNDHGADYLKFYSGNYSTSSSRPTLLIEYTVP